MTLPGIEIKQMPALNGKHLHPFTLFLISAIHAFFWGNYDLIHIHNVEACFVLPLLRLRYKVIATSHGNAYERLKWNRVAKELIHLMDYPFVIFANVITSVAQPLAAFYEQRYKRAVEFLPNGVDTPPQVDHLSAKKLLAQYGLVPKQYLLFAAGRIIPTKGCHFLLEALCQLDREVDLLVVGDMSHVPEYEKKLHMMAGDRVHFCSFIAEKETLMGLLDLACLFIFPSTVEAMSMMLLEAASVGTPTIVSDIPENMSLLDQQALYFRSGDSAHLACQIQWAIDHPGQMAQLANAARQKLIRSYSWSQIVRDYESLYLRALS